MGEDILSDATIEKFNRAADYLIEQGWKVRNPVGETVQLDIQQVHSKMEAQLNRELTDKERYESSLVVDIIMLSHCDAIYLLPDWKESPGAIAEAAFAQAVGKEIIYGKTIYDPHYDLVRLDMSVRLLNCLKGGAYQIENLEECKEYHVTDFLKLRHLGKKTLRELKQLMQKYGFEFKR